MHFLKVGTSEKSQNATTNLGFQLAEWRLGGIPASEEPDPKYFPNIFLLNIPTLCYFAARFNGKAHWASGWPDFLPQIKPNQGGSKHFISTASLYARS
jgi:hypothetical protein